MIKVYYWRISKYNPKFRDLQGVYKNDEWTSICDIGKRFNNSVLTFDEYIKFEDAYVYAILLAISETHLDSITIRSLEKKQIINCYDLPYDHVVDYVGSLVDKADVLIGDTGDISLLIRLVLREIIWCKLEAGPNLFIHFGYDYYMYFGSKERLDTTMGLVRKRGLFAEKLQSPYLVT